MIAIQHRGFARPGKEFAARVRAAAARISLAGGATIRLAGVDDVRALNKKYRGLDRATDVLSFPAGDAPPGEPAYAGDVIICVPLAVEQARECGHSLQRELLLLAIHGLLHLQGLDHETDGGQMLARQRELFAEFAAELP